MTLRRANELANERRFPEALDVCADYQRTAGPAAEVYFLMGMIHQSAADLDAAEDCFHKTLYLDAAHAEACLALALLAGQRGDARLAQLYRRAAARVVARRGAE
jgi:chemotaxis protein methyltransferase WspC